jgi:hypothetical protein
MRAERPISMPMAMPKAAASAKPANARCSETKASMIDSGRVKNSTSSREIFSSGGNSSGFHRPLRDTASQASKMQAMRISGGRRFTPAAPARRAPSRARR